MSYEQLKLDNQICHRLYLASNGLTRLYRPLLEALGVTYPQYVVLMALWEEDRITMKDLSIKTSIDKGFLASLVKYLDKENLIEILSDEQDKRKKIIKLTEKAKLLEEKAKDIPLKLICSLDDDKINIEQIEELKKILDNVNFAINEALSK